MMRYILQFLGFVGWFLLLAVLCWQGREKFSFDDYVPSSGRYPWTTTAEEELEEYYQDQVDHLDLAEVFKELTEERKSLVLKDLSSCLTFKEWKILVRTDDCTSETYLGQLYASYKLHWKSTSTE